MNGQFRHSRKPRTLLRNVKVDQFLLEEYKLLRREIEIHLAERAKIETQVFIGVFVVFSWMATNSEKLTDDYERIGLGLPMVLVALGFLRWWAIHARTLSISNYIQTIETNFRADEEGGWETHLSLKRKKEPVLGNPQGSVEFIGWLVMFALSAGIYLYKFRDSAGGLL